MILILRSIRCLHLGVFRLFISSGLAGISINSFMVLNTSENVCTRHWQTSEAKASQTD